METLRQYCAAEPEVVDSLGRILNLINQQTSTDPAQHEQHDRTTVSGLPTPVFGRDEELNHLVNLLTTSANKPSHAPANMINIHAIYGVGGGGKTTLAQYLFHDERVSLHFELKMWVHVSSNFDVEKITKNVIEAASDGNSPPKSSNLDVLQNKLKKTLKSKKFLLVLDDIWCEERVKWDQLVIPFNNFGHPESRILITTRTKSVASMLGIESQIPLKELKTEDCRAIMMHYAFGEANKVIEDLDLQNVAEQIVPKLYRSPLAARVLGCSLGKNVNIDAWKMLLKDDMLKNTRDTLLLSYYHLPPHLRRCFAFSSLYPKGFHFNDVDNLVMLWIAEGYVETPQNKDISLEELGRHYFKDLVSYSFFESHNISSERGCVHIIHDLLHDLAEKVSEDACFRIESNELVTIPRTIMHLSIATKTLPHIPEILKLESLRTLIILETPLDKSLFVSKIMKKIFKNLRKFRVLDFGDYIIGEFDISYCQLKHLKYLKARKVNKLPKTFCTLYHLQYLVLSENEVNELPDRFNNLINLRYGGDILTKVRKIGSLTSLQELGCYRVRKNAADYGIGQLENLNQIHGDLIIGNLENVKDGAEAATAKLKDKSHLDGLSLIWYYGDESDDKRNSRGDVDVDVVEEVLEGLQPHPNLKRLVLEFYQGCKLPKWCYLHNLHSFTVNNCANLLEISSFPHCLQCLHVHTCPQLKHLAAFPSSLVEIEIDECPEIENLLWTSGNNEDNALNAAPQKKFDLLSKMWVRRLQVITRVILGPGQRAFKKLDFYGCENLRYLGGFESVTFVDSICICDCPELTSLGNLQLLISLKTLQVTGCPKLKTADHRLLSFEGHLTIDELVLLPVLFEEQGLNSLKQFQIFKCPQDVPFTVRQQDVFLHLTSLSDLAFLDCENLPCLPGILEKLSSLKRLIIDGCLKMNSLPNLPTSLDSLIIESCEKTDQPSLLELPSSLLELIWDPRIYADANHSRISSLIIHDI